MRLRATLLTALLALAVAAPASAQAPRDLLPDLDQMVPTELSVQSVRLGAKTVHRLGFSSAAANVGLGPLTLHGRRPDRAQTTMTVNQLVKQTAGPSRVVRDVGLMSYVVHPDHDHWHLLGFERYELRIAGDPAALPRRDRKTGFCLGDRFALPKAASLFGFSSTPLQADLCGMGKPGLLNLFSGISVGYGDRYDAHIEGQFIDVTGLPSGRYELVHRVNTEGRIAERDYTNNASSVLFSLTWPAERRRAPAVRVLRSCPASETCVP
jgi:hypothetical protein